MTPCFRQWAVLCAIMLLVMAPACGNNETKSNGAARTSEKVDQAASTKDATEAEPAKPAAALKTEKAPSAKNIQWLGYEEGISRAKSDGKKIFLNFYAEWCHYCKRMDNTTFADNNIIAYLNDNFVPIKVNSDRKPRRAAEFGVKGLPMFWFLNETGERIGNQPGYMPAATLLPLLKFIHTDAYQQMGFNEFLKQM